MNGSVRALAYDAPNNDLWVGGSFNDEVNAPNGLLNHIARFNTAGTVWNSTQCKGLSSDVNAIVVSGSNIYVGGAFSQTADASVTCTNADKTHLNKIARYSGGTSWTALADYGINGLGVFALAVDGVGDIYVGGSFNASFAGFTPNMNNFAIYSSGAWVLPSSFANGLNNTSGGNVNSLAIIGTDLYVGGTFTKSADNTVLGLNNLAIYRASHWVAAPASGLQIAPAGGSVDAIAYTGIPTQYNVYAGGAFDSTGDGLTTNLRFVAALANTCNATGNGNWSSAGTWGCGEVPTSADQVTIPNGTTVTLDADATVDGQLTLNGDLDASTSGKILTLGQHATVSGTGDVFGIVRHLFPAGFTGVLYFNNANARISLNGGATLTGLDVKMEKKHPSLSSDYVNRIYTITPTGSGPFFATLRLSYKPADFVGSITESALTLWRYNSTTWSNQGGTADTTNHYIEINNITQFSPWAFSVAAPSAVTFTQFEAHVNNGLGAWPVVGALLACVVVVGGWVARKRRA